MGDVGIINLIVMHGGNKMGSLRHGIGFVGDKNVGIALGGSYIGVAQ